jgi:hypothetical protein
MCPQLVQGTLKECDESFICNNRDDDEPNVSIPMSAIHRIEPVQANLRT